MNNFVSNMIHNYIRDQNTKQINFYKVVWLLGSLL